MALPTTYPFDTSKQGGSSIECILGIVDSFNYALSDIKCIMIQSTGSQTDIASNIYTILDGKKQLSHYAIDASGAIKYAYNNTSVIDPTNVVFTQKAITMLKNTKETNDSPASHILVLELCIPAVYGPVEITAIKFIGDLLTKYGLTKDNLWRRSDIISGDTINPVPQYSDLASWTKFLSTIDKYILDKKADLTTGNTVVLNPAIVIQPDSRIKTFSSLKSLDAEKLSLDMDYTKVGSGSVATRIDKFTNETSTIEDPDNKYEPIYPDYTVPPSNTTGLYDKKVKDIDEEAKAIKPVLGKIVNNNDPYPVDDKILELEIHRPKVKVDEITLNGVSTSPGCTLINNDMVLAGYLKDLSRRTENRLVQLENMMSTVTRNLFRLSSRININCVYYGGQASYDKYNCIRCLADDMINDGQIVSLDQCLNCSRFEPIIGQTYEILNEEMYLNLGPILDDNQMARMSMKNYIDLVSVDKMHSEASDAFTDMNKITSKNSTLKSFEEVWDKGKSMDWKSDSLELEVPDVKLYNYNPDSISEIKSEVLKPGNKNKDNYDKTISQKINVPIDGYEIEVVEIEGAKISYSSNSARELITKQALAYIDICRAGKGAYSQKSRLKTINGMLYLDCSSLAMMCYKAAGITMGCYAQSKVQAKYCKTSGTTFTDLSKAKPGDLVFYSHDGTVNAVYHIEVYIGDNKSVGANEPNIDSTKDWNIREQVITKNFLFFGTPPELMAIDTVVNTSGMTFTQGYMNPDTHQFNIERIKKATPGMIKRATATIENMHKYNYEKKLLDECKKYGYDAKLILSLIATESTGNPTAHSTGSSYYGLMQMKKGSLEANKNIEQGTKHLGTKLDCFGIAGKENSLLGILAYNCGEGVVKKALSNLGIAKSDWSTVKMGPVSEAAALDAARRWGQGKIEEVNNYIINIMVAYNQFLTMLPQEWGK